MSSVRHWVSHIVFMSVLLPAVMQRHHVDVLYTETVTGSD